MPDANAILAFIGALLTLAGGSAFTVWQKGKPERDRKREREVAVSRAIIGAREVRDEAGGIIAEEEPGLVQRTITLEDTVKTLAQVVARQADNTDEIVALKREQLMHGVRLTSLERNQDERVAIREESAAQWRAVADQNVIDADPET